MNTPYKLGAPGVLCARDTVYISGPMTGIEGFNRHAFLVAEAMLMQEVGCRVLNPGRHPDGWTYPDYMRAAYRDLCEATVVVLLPGWETSRGAVAEVNAAAILDLPVIPLVGVL